MLKMRIDPNADFLSGRRVTVEAPYEMVGRYILSDASSLHSVNLLLEKLASFEKGEKPVPLTGNAYSLDYEGETTKVVKVVGVESEIAVPTKWLVAALEQWRDYLSKRRPK